MDANRRLRVGIFGLGAIGIGHLSALCESGLADVVAAADVDPIRREEAAAKFSVTRSTADYREILDMPDVDLVVVGTPHHLHREMVVDSLTAGKHTIVEKPIASSVADARQMLSAAERADRRLFVAHSVRFLPSSQRIRALIESGAIGEGFFGVTCSIGDEIARMSDPNSWKGSLACGGGVLLDAGVHVVDILRAFFGDVEWVSAFGWQSLIKQPDKGEDTAMVKLGFESGPVVEIITTFVARYNGFPVNYVGGGLRHDFYGDRGSLHFVSNEPIIVCDKNGRHAYEHGDAGVSCLLAEDEHFIRCILEEREPIVTANDGFEALRVVEAAYESMRAGRKVNLSEINARTY